MSYRSTVPTFHPEYGRYMLESTPGAPYTGTLKDLMSVENNMRYRYILFCLPTPHTLSISFRDLCHLSIPARWCIVNQGGNSSVQN